MATPQKIKQWHDLALAQMAAESYLDGLINGGGVILPMNRGHLNQGFFASNANVKTLGTGVGLFSCSELIGV